MTVALPTLGELLSGAKHSADHLEMRDVYMCSDPDFEPWRAGHRPNPADRSSWWNSWYELVRTTVDRGVQIRRARVISEPASEYVRFEHDWTFANIASGEDVRWLPRPRASDLALPGNDFWLIDKRIVLFNLFAGDGELPDIDAQVTEDPSVASLCESSFESVWERAIPHDEYTPQ